MPQCSTAGAIRRIDRSCCLTETGDELRPSRSVSSFFKRTRSARPSFCSPCLPTHLPPSHDGTEPCADPAVDRAKRGAAPGPIKTVPSCFSSQTWFRSSELILKERYHRGAMRRLVVASHAPNGQGEGVPPPRNAGEADAGGGILAPPSAPQAVGITTCVVLGETTMQNAMRWYREELPSLSNYLRLAPRLQPVQVAPRTASPHPIRAHPSPRTSTVVVAGRQQTGYM